jgi:hypothetical protein
MEVPHAVEEAAIGLAAREVLRADLLAVGAAGEGLALPRDDDRPDGGILRDLAKRLRQRRIDRVVQHVLDLGPVQPEALDCADPLPDDDVLHVRSLPARRRLC